MESGAPACLTDDALHLWQEEPTGWRCQLCHTFTPSHQAPWGPVLDEEEEEPPDAQ